MSCFGVFNSMEGPGGCCRLRSLAFWRGALRCVVLGCIALFVMALAAVPVHASTFAVENVLTQYVQTAVTSRNGLPQNSVHAVAQDPDGYLWFGTEEGLVRYDGKRTEVFDRRSNAELPDNNISAISADENGGLWTGMPSGVAHFERGRFVSHILARANSVLDVVCDSKGVVWVGTEKGLYTVKENALRPVPGIGLGFQVKQIVAGRDGRLWLAMSTGLTGIDSGLVRRYGAADGLPGTPVRAIATGANGSLWLAYDSEIVHWNGQVLERIALSRIARDANVTALLEDAGGRLWIGFQHHGLAVVQDGHISRYTGRNALQSDDVLTLKQDREGNLWVGFADGGVVGFHAGLFNTIGDREGLSQNMTWVALAARDGSMWVGTNNKGLDHLMRDGRVEHLDGRRGMPEEQVGALFEDGDGSLWAGFEGGDLSHIQGGRVTTFHNRERVKTSVRCILRGPGGALYLLYHAENGLVRFRNGRFETPKENVPGMPTFALTAPDGSLWIASSHGGVNLWNNGVRRHFGADEGLRSTFLTSLLLDPDGTVWVGSSNGGLSRIRDGRVATVTPDDGLFDYVVGAIVDDQQGYLWITCNKGIYKVRKQELNDFADGRAPSVHSIVYGLADGMRSAECNYGSVPSVARSSDGRLWFATTAGLASVLPSTSQSRSSKPAAVLEEAVVDEKRTEMPESVVAAARATHNLEFAFTAPDFTAPERTHFRFRLEGYDNRWIPVGGRRLAFYNRLPPGEYLFLLQASNGEEWPAHSTSVPVIIRAYFWQTRGFAVLLGGLVLLAGFGAYQYRIFALRHRSRTLQECVVQRTAELQKAIREAEVAQQALQEQATRDGLTRLWNRRYIFDMLCKESRRAERERLSLCVLMLDVDHFKHVNDTAGHLGGDRVLEGVAQVLTDYTRPYDYAGRYGGEEFLIILCNCTLEAGMRRAETIRAAIEGADICFHDMRVPVTASFGVAVNDVGKTIEAVLQEADEALYRAKQGGRNRVCSFEPAPVVAREREGLMQLDSLWGAA